MQCEGRPFAFLAGLQASISKRLFLSVRPWIDPDSIPQNRYLRRGFITMLIQSLDRLRQCLWQSLLSIAIIGLVWTIADPAQAALDPYVAQYLKVMPDNPVSLPIDSSGQTREFGYDELVQGKELFGKTCLSCHVGGATLASPGVSLSLKDLQNATPPRDTIQALVAYMRHPLAYDGSDENFYCREVPESWLSQAEVESIAGFVLRAAQKAQGWGKSPM